MPDKQAKGKNEGKSAILSGHSQPGKQAYRLFVQNGPFDHLNGE
jgi:hypothetical protein